MSYHTYYPMTRELEEGLEKWTKFIEDKAQELNFEVVETLNVNFGLTYYNDVELNDGHCLRLFIDDNYHPRMVIKLFKNDKSRLGYGSKLCDEENIKKAINALFKAIKILQQ